MNIIDVRLLYKAETGDYPFVDDPFVFPYPTTGKIQEEHIEYDIDRTIDYINWLENKVVELKNEKL